jgi:hypothetical protein
VPAAWRASNLPNKAIVDAVTAKFNGVSVTADINMSGVGAGNFVSNYMAYLVAWYREWWEVVSKDPAKTCMFAGHTHVGDNVAVSDATTAIEIQLDVLIKRLP